MFSHDEALVAMQGSLAQCANKPCLHCKEAFFSCSPTHETGTKPLLLRENKPCLPLRQNLFRTPGIAHLRC